MADYALPPIVTVNGTFTFTLKNATVTGLTQPTIQTVLSIDALEETLDVKAVITEIPKLTIAVRDDYSVTAYGFWYALLAGTTEILVTLDEGAGATHFFYGILNKELIEWEEHYVSTTRIRTAKISFDSIVKTLIDATLKTWIDDIPARAEATGQTSPIPSKVVKFQQFFASLLYTSALNASYDENDVTFAIGTMDFKYSRAATEYPLSDVRIATHYDAGGGDTLTHYFQTLHANYLPTMYESTHALLSDLCKNLGIVFRLGYASGRHTLLVMQRGRAYTGAVTFGSPERLKKSSITLATDIIEKYIRATQLINAASYAWTTAAGSVETGAPSTDIEFGIDFKTLFGAAGGFVGDGPTWSLFDGGNYATLGEIDEVEAYNYDTPGYQTYPIMEKACVYYYYHRYASERKRIFRTYGTLKANDGVDDSHEHIHILRRVSINDGTGAANYFANRVKKMPISNEVEVEWIEE